MSPHPKTNAIRIVESAGVAFKLASYEVDEEHLDTVTAADKLGVEADRIFKTIVMVDEKNNHYAFCVPGPFEVDPKRAARACGARSLEPVKLAELFAVTGYVRGGCSPIGMKRPFTTIIDETAQVFNEILVSAGARGLQITIAPADLANLVGASFADISR